jgi:hypothetical protein
MGRRRHHKAEKLSAAARRIVEDGLLMHVPYPEIADKVVAETGEEIGPSSIARYYTAKFSPRQEATSQAVVMAAEMTKWMGGVTDGDLARAMQRHIAQQLQPQLQVLAEEDPARAAEFFASMEKNRIAEARLQQRQGELELRAKQLELQAKLAEGKLQEIARRAQAALDEKGKTKERTPAELEQLLRDLYGIASPAPKVVTVGAPEASHA